MYKIPVGPNSITVPGDPPSSSSGIKKEIRFIGENERMNGSIESGGPPLGIHHRQVVFVPCIERRSRFTHFLKYILLKQP